MPEIQNPALDRMRAGGVALGMVVRLARSGEIARIAGTTGHDFVFLDMQHAGFSLEVAAAIAQVAMGCGVTALARVRGVDDPNIGVLLDCGVTGIVVPDVDSAVSARKVVDAVRFAPVGRRSLSTPQASLGYRSMPQPDAMLALNRSTLLACMIETRDALSNVNEIAKVDGVDVLQIGCTDLLVDMGIPGSFDDPQLTDAIRHVVAAARENGKFAGVGGLREIERLAAAIGEGVQFATAHADIALVLAEAGRRTEALRAHVAGRRPA